MIQRSTPENRGGFPATHISAIVAAASGDREMRTRGLAAVVAAYRLPVYKYIRMRWNREREEAEDLTQGFFAEAIEKNWLGRFDPQKARFRTFLRTCLDGYLANEQKASERIKRGGEFVFVSLDFDDAERQLAAGTPQASTTDEYFEREFARSLFALAVERLREELQAAGKGIYFQLFEEYVLADDDAEQRPGYKDLAEKHGLAVTTVTNHLAAARRAFRTVLLERLRELTVTDEEYRSEARALLGIEPE